MVSRERVLIISILCLAFILFFMSSNYSQSSAWAPNIDSQDEHHTDHLDYSRPIGQQISTSAAGYHCLAQALSELPIIDNQIVANHREAQNGKWNGRDQYHAWDGWNLTKSPPPGCKFMYVGAGARSNELERLMLIYRGCDFHVYEPIPAVADSLANYFNSPEVKKRLTTFPIIHPYSLGKSRKTKLFDPSEIQQSGNNRGLEINLGNEPIEIQIYDITTELKLLKIAEDDMVTTLNVNCYGCEWELLNWIGQLGLFPKFKYLQFTTRHARKQSLGAEVLDLCTIRQYLLRTHMSIKTLAFGWELWEQEIHVHH